MIDFAALKSGLSVIVATLTGLASNAVELDPGRNSFGGVTARYSLIGWASVGVDDTLLERMSEEEWEQSFGSTPWGGASPPLLETASGRRTFTLRIKIVGFDHTAGSEAETYLERARTRLRWMSVTQAFNALGVGFERVLSYGLLNDKVDDRASTTAYIDIGLNIHVRETDTENPIDPIDAADDITFKDPV